VSDQTIHVTELDVRRARLLATLARRLGKTPPASVLKVARVKLPGTLGSAAASLSPSMTTNRTVGRGSGGRAGGGMS
jgi:hypothetical protein